MKILASILEALDAAAHECANATPADLDRLKDLAQGWAHLVEQGREAQRIEDEAHDAALREGLEEAQGDAADAHAIELERDGNEISERAELDAEELYAGPEEE